MDSVIVGDQDAHRLAMEEGTGRRKLLRLSSNNPQLFDTACDGQFLLSLHALIMSAIGDAGFLAKYRENTSIFASGRTGWPGRGAAGARIGEVRDGDCSC